MIQVSHIVTVYNKAKYLPDTIASLLNQDGNLAREFIFVDDVSTDDSVKVIEECTRGVANITIVRNTENKGPSVRLNQGAALARGQFLHFLDSDDMVPRNAMRVMHKALQDTQADFLYGKWKWTHKPGSKLHEERIPNEDTVQLAVSDDPLGTILHGRNRRMCLMVRRECFAKAGGADPRVFIQDESLPLRLAIHASRFVRISAVANLIPQTEENLSGNKSQLNHDRFFAYRNALLDYPELPPASRARIYFRCVSAYWKEVHARDGVKAFFMLPFWRYNWTKWFGLSLSLAYVAKMTDFFAQLPNVRRVA